MTTLVDVAVPVILRQSFTYTLPEADLLGANATFPKKRGPASRLEQLAGKLGSLPRSKQTMILDMMEGAIEKAS